MLYVFSVDTGTVLTFDMNVALETVAQLKEAIFKASKVPPEKQVLLVSGGESLDATRRVCSYSAGTDTNPIFLFCKTTIESPTPPSLSTNQGSAQELRDRLESCLADKETTYGTVAARAQLAQQLYDSARDQVRVCEQLVHDQHMQQQGWAAGVANLDDIVTEFRGRAEFFRQAYTQYLDARSELLEILANFSEDLQMLSDIPVLPSLIAESPTTGKEMTLLDWMRSHEDEQTNLNLVADLCSKGLEQLDNKLLYEIRSDVDGALKMADHLDMKEIRGLGERLFSLGQLLHEARRVVSEQGELAQSFQQNQLRARNLNDPSVLPDLCAFHKQHLKVMLKNDEKLRDIRSRCSRAKEELSSNLHHRLRWMMYVQRKLAEIDGRLCLHHENLRRLRRHLDLLKQLHNAPVVYFKSLIEIVRRRQFSEKFQKWASALAEECSSLHQNELGLRQTYRQLSENHFLTVLFPGMDDLPPPFATVAPPAFDASLPRVTLDDVGTLQQTLPTLWALLELPTNLKKAVRDSVPSSTLSNPLPVKESSQSSPSPSSGLLPSLSAALLSPPLKSLRSQNSSSSAAAAPGAAAAHSAVFNNAVSRSLGDFQRTEFFIDDSLPSPTFPDQCHSSECVELHRKLEEQLEDQRCSLLNAQAQLQCVLEAGQTLLPALRKELTELRALSSENESWKLLDHVRADVLSAANSLVQNMETDFREKLDKVREELEITESEKAALEEENRSLKEQLVDLELAKNQELETLRHDFEKEKEEMMREKEAQLQAVKDQVTQKLNLEHELEVESLQEELRSTREKWEAEKRVHQQHVAELDRKLAEAIFARASAEEERLETLRRELLLEHEMELEQVRQEKEEAVQEVEKSREDEWKTREEALEKEHQLQMQKIQEEMQHKHRMEIEGLRSRFRMMTSATLGERTPSETALENMDIRGTPPASPRVLPRPTMDTPISEEIRRAVDEEARRWEERLLAEKEALRQLIQRGKSSAPDKEHSWWMDSLSKALTESNHIIKTLGKKVDELQREVDRSKVGSPLTRSISQGGISNMATSVAVLSESPSSSSLADQAQKRVLSKRSRHLIKQGSANVYGCEKGDTVLVQWDDRFATFMIFNKGSYLHFLHTDSLEALGLTSKRSEIEPFLGKVVYKEYCLVRKDENRYKLPKGTNFYRVKVERRDIES